MAGYVLSVGDIVTCTHQAPTTPPPPMSRVRVSGQPAVTTMAPYTVVGCAATNTCLTGAWTQGAIRAQTMGLPLAIDTGSSTCLAGGTPLKVVSVQQRVTAS